MYTSSQCTDGSTTKQQRHDFAADLWYKDKHQSSQQDDLNVIMQLYGVLAPSIYGYKSCTLLTRNSSVGTATRYGMDAPGIESLWRRDFPHSSVPPLGVHPASSTMCCGFLSWGVKRPGSGVDHPLPSSGEVKERVELYLYSSPGIHGPFLGWNLSFDIFSPNNFYLYVFGLYIFLHLWLLKRPLFSGSAWWWLHIGLNTYLDISDT